MSKTAVITKDFPDKPSVVWKVITSDWSSSSLSGMLAGRVPDINALLHEKCVELIDANKEKGIFNITIIEDADIVDI